ncbi:hypothetical protein JW977_01365 [Candidatus Falkowbacteria bacterium]|nr:hypothetical protein [Candidatus Falkowbacteria bacterium]
MKKVILGIIVFLTALTVFAGVPNYAYKDGHFIPTLIEIDKTIAGEDFDQLRLNAESLKNCPECIVIIQGVGENPGMKAETVKLWLLNNEKVPQNQVRILKTAGMQPIKTTNNGVLLTIATKQDLEDEKFPENIYVKSETGYKPLYVKGDCQLLGKLNDTLYLIKLLCPGFTCATPECMEIVPITPTKPDCSICKNCPECQKGQAAYIEKSDKEILKDSLLYWGPIGAAAGLGASLFYVEGAHDNNGNGGGNAGMCVKKDVHDGIEYDWGCVALVTVGGYAAGVGIGYLGEKTYYVGKGNNKKEVTLAPTTGGIKASWK